MKLLPYLAGGAVTLIFGFSFTATRGVLDSVDAMHLLALRFMFASVFLWGLRLTGILKISYKGRKTAPLYFLALFQPLLYFIFETIGINMTSASESGLMIALIPVVVAVMSYFFLKERPSRTQWLFILTSVAGVVFITVMKGLNTTGGLAGFALLAGAVISAGVFNILSRKLSLSFKPIEITFFMMTAGFLVFNAISLTEHLMQERVGQYFVPFVRTQTLMTLIYLGVLSSVGAFFLLNYMLSKLEAAQVAVFGNLVTVVSIFAGIIILNEQFSWFHIAGSVLILVGVWGTNRYRSLNLS